jgi:hypothetical protein
LHFLRDDGEGAAVSTGACSFDRRVEGEQLGLIGDLLDHAGDRPDLLAAATERLDGASEMPTVVTISSIPAKVSRTMRPPSCASIPERCAMSDASAMLAFARRDRLRHLRGRAGDEQRLADLLLGTARQLVRLRLDLTAGRHRGVEHLADLLHHRPDVEHGLVDAVAKSPDRVVAVHLERDREIALGEALHRVEHFEDVALQILLCVPIAFRRFREGGVQALEAHPALPLHAQGIPKPQRCAEQNDGTEPPRCPEGRHDLDLQRRAFVVPAPSLFVPFTRKT